MNGKKLIDSILHNYTIIKIIQKLPNFAQSITAHGRSE